MGTSGGVAGRVLRRLGGTGGNRDTDLSISFFGGVYQDCSALLLEGEVNRMSGPADRGGPTSSGHVVDCARHGVGYLPGRSPTPVPVPASTSAPGRETLCAAVGSSPVL